MMESNANFSARSAAPNPEPATDAGANPTQTIRQRKVNRWRLGWFLAALGLLTAGTLWFCWLQPPAPVELNPTKISWKKWLWQPHEKNPAKRLTTVPDSDLHGAFFTNDLGWVVGDGGVILHTKDGGQTWQWQTNITWPVARPQPIPKSAPKSAPKDGAKKLSSLAGKLFVSRQSLLAANPPLFTQTAYPDFPNQADPKQNSQNSKAPDLKPAENLPENLRPPWEQKTAPAGEPTISKSLTGVYFADEKNGWAVGDGVVLHTTDGGETWTAGSDVTDPYADFSGNQAGWSVGARGTILHSDDGQTWNCRTFNAARLKHGDLEKAGAYSRWPAAMYYLVLLLSLVCLRIGLLKKNEVEMFTPSIADFAVSDRPLTSRDFDALNFGPLAQGLANFLRNKSTTGPLTLAVAGPWGSGKSSIMGLLREKLERQGIRPVWFNAWHHQDEKQLLAALLENIRSQAVPPWYSWRGASFRMKLINRRMQRQWPMLFVGTLFLASFAALLNWLVQDGLSWDAVKAMLAKPDLFSAGKLAVLLTALATGWKMLQGFQAFGLNPAKLLASVTEKAKLSDLGEQTSFRHRFAQEFEDVTAALQPRTMTVFIDDLDRCEPDQVMSVMQSLNFLSSSGECFLIIGMEENAVTNCVAISLKEQFDSQQGHKLDETASVQRRWEYARLWMEKLIQIRIPVPDPSDDQFRALLTGKNPGAEKTTPRNMVVEWASRCWEAVRPALPWAGVLAVILAGFFITGFELEHCPWLKTQLTPKPEAPATAVAWPANSLIQPGGLASVQLTVPEGVPGLALMTNANFGQWFAKQKWNVNLAFAPNLPTNGNQGTGGEGDTNANLAADSPAGTGKTTDGKAVALTLVPGQRHFGGWWLALPFLVVVLVYGWKKIAEILEQRYGDSDDFRRALHRWSDVIQADAGTPRAAKRLINKLRFYAMMSRALKSAKMADIPENVVVAFGVNEHRIRHGVVERDDTLGGLLRAEASLNPGGAIKSIGTDVSELESAFARQPEIFRYLSSTLKTEGGKPKAA